MGADFPLRLRYFVWHASATIVAAGALLCVVFLLWYPAPFGEHLGVARLAWLTFAGLFVLGPICSLAFCRPGKRSIRQDFVLLIALQVLVFGLAFSAFSQGRVVWVVFTIDRFELVRADEVDTRKIKDSAAAYRRNPWLGPGWVVAQQPDDPEIRSQVLFESVFSGIDVQHHPEFYVPVETAMSSLLDSSRPLSELYALNDPAIVDLVLRRHPSPDRWLPLAYRDQFFTVLFSATQFRPVVVDLRPY